MPQSSETEPLPVKRTEKLLSYDRTPIHLLKGADNNARKHSDAQLTALKNSIAEFGMPSPIIINVDYDIVAGHGRWEAAKLLGWTSVPTLQVEHLSSEQQRLFALADNRIAELSTWDEKKRAEEFRALRLEMPDLDLTLSGFAHPEIELDIAGLEHTAWSDLDKQPEQIPSKQVTQLGDIWDFEGGHTLVCGDSTQADNVATAVNGETVQLVEEDLPYNLRARDYSGNGKHKHGNFEMAGGEMRGQEFIDFMARSFKAILPHCKDGALFYAFMDWRHIGQLLAAGDHVGFELKNLVVWDKGKGGMGSLYRNAHELIAVFKHGKAPHINNAVERRSGAGRGGGRRFDQYGIDRLRPLIVDLAVRGKLTSQETSEEPAAVALANLAKARRSKIESGQARKPKTLNPLPLDLPSLPVGWAWTQLGTVAEISPSNRADDELAASFVPMALVSTKIDGVHDAEIRKWSEIKKGFTHFAEGDIGLAKITPCFENGKAAIFENLANGIGAGTTELHVARPWSEDINRRYLLLTMKTASYLKEGEARMTGTAGQKRVTRTYFESTPLPFPPLAEQQRIVAKVDELMTLCDMLEAESAAAIAAHQALAESLLTTLTTSTDAADLSLNWARLEAHFDIIFTTEASVDALKQAILELAVRGKLVPQHTHDEPASELLKAIKGQMADLARRGRARTPPKIAPIRDDDVPFSVPAGWAFARFGDVLVNRDAERIPISSDDRARRKGEFDYYGASGVIDHIDDYIFDGPLLLVGEDGANLINRSTPIAFIADGKYWVNNHAHVLQAISMPLLRYMELFINAIDLKPYVTGTAQPKMNQAKMNSIVVAIPPAKELDRIVAKVEELNALCNALRSRIEETAATQRHLAAVVVERAAA